MPNINSISIPRYTADMPYYFIYDNLPFDALLQREAIINAAVDANSEVLRLAGGSLNLAGRLDQSLYDNGQIKPEAVDASLHNIGAHTDDSYVVSSGQLSNLQLYYPALTNPVSFVRMLEVERTKLALMQEEANFFGISAPTASGITYFNSDYLNLQDSTTVKWTVDAGQTLSAEVTSSLSNAHMHYDNVVPDSATLTPNFIDYRVAIAFKTGSLKVYINGLRIFSDNPVYAPSSDPSLPWTLNSFTEDLDFKGFSLLNAITGEDIIYVDFEVSLV